jgi:hypothetical protein
MAAGSDADAISIDQRDCDLRMPGGSMSPPVFLRGGGGAGEAREDYDPV